MYGLRLTCNVSCKKCQNLLGPLELHIQVMSNYILSRQPLWTGSSLKKVTESFQKFPQYGVEVF